MPIGKRTGQQGFTYLLLLFAITLGGISLAALGEQAKVRMQREREAELMFRGKALKQAISSYLAASPAGSRAPPQTVDDLLDDRRSGRSVRHLRKLYLDPFTGAADWRWLQPGQLPCGASSQPAADTQNSARALGVAGVASASTQQLMQSGAAARRLACELVFVPTEVAPTQGSTTFIHH